MTYQRKTKDEYQLHVNYGQGWEHEISEDSRKAIREQYKTYRENSPQYPLKIIVKRIPIGTYSVATRHISNLGDW